MKHKHKSNLWEPWHDDSFISGTEQFIRAVVWWQFSIWGPGLTWGPGRAGADRVAQVDWRRPCEGVGVSQAGLEGERWTDIEGGARHPAPRERVWRWKSWLISILLIVFICHLVLGELISFLLTEFVAGKYIAQFLLLHHQEEYLLKFRSIYTYDISTH